MASATLIHVDALFPPMWTAIRPYLQSALDVGGGIRDWDTDDVYQAGIENRIDLWALATPERIFGGAASQVNHFPKRKNFEILLLGTDPQCESEWMECLQQFCSLAVANGAATITGTGRPGWARKLRCNERRIFEVQL